MRIRSQDLLFFCLLLGSCQSWGSATGMFAELHTAKGVIVVRLEHTRTPLTVANFVGLAEGTIANGAEDLGTPVFDGAVFGRVVEGHVIQGGRQGLGYTFVNEIDPSLSHDHAGALGMANGGPHTNSGQFYITLGDRSYLDGDYTVFGEVVEGIDVVRSIVKDDKIEKVVIRRVGAAALAFRPDTETFRALQAEGLARVEREDLARAKDVARWIQQRWPTATASADGVHSLVVRQGRGTESPSSGDRVTLRYTGETPSGIGFHSGADGRPLAPRGDGATFEHVLGERGLPRGLQAALMKMRRGEVRVAVLPAASAYGRRGYYGPNIPGQPRFVISPDSTIAYEVELVGF